LAACRNCDQRGYGWLVITTAANLRSQAVMRRIGMTREPTGDFDDPGVPAGPLRRNVLYRIRSAPAR
jgi:RimJ/RimL family protein N-acetyltransferase